MDDNTTKYSIKDMVIPFAGVVLILIIGIAIMFHLQSAIDYDELHLQLTNQTNLDNKSCSELSMLRSNSWALSGEGKIIIETDLDNALRYRACN